MGNIGGEFWLFFLALAAIAAAWAYMQYFEWSALPTLDEYLEKYPDCKSGRGVRCNVCNGHSFRNWGVFGPESTHRKFICNSCGTSLYRR